MATKHQLQVRALSDTVKAQEIEIARLKMETKEKDRRIEIAEKMATYDFLTGLLNKRGGNEVLEHHFSIMKRDASKKSNFAILNLDLDRFSGVNNTYGHAMGDKVLQFFAGVLTGTLRNEHDVVIRVGGDEFIIILPECNLKQAETVKSKVKQALARNSFVDGKVKLSLRTSVGIAMARNEAGKLHHPLKKILYMADKAMYEDKKVGEKLRLPK